MEEEALKQKFEDCKKLALDELEALKVFQRNHEEELDDLGETFAEVASMLLTGASLRNPALLSLGPEIAGLTTIIFQYGYMLGSEAQPAKLEI